MILQQFHAHPHARDTGELCQAARYSKAFRAPITVKPRIPPSTAPLPDRPTACPVKLDGVGVTETVVLTLVRLPIRVVFAV